MAASLRLLLPSRGLALLNVRASAIGWPEGRPRTSTSSQREMQNDEMVCRRDCLLIDRNFCTRHDARTARSIGKPDHAGRGRVRSGSNAGQRHLRSANDNPPDPSRHAQVSAMAGKCLCGVRIGVTTSAFGSCPDADHHDLKPSQANCPCRAARRICGLTCRLGRAATLEILGCRLRSMDSGGRVSGRGSIASAFATVGLSIRLTGGSVTSDDIATSGILTAGAAATTVGDRVSKTIRSGHLRSE